MFSVVSNVEGGKNNETENQLTMVNTGACLKFLRSWIWYNGPYLEKTYTCVVRFVHICTQS